MSITISLTSATNTLDASADLGSPSRCGALNFANVNAVIVLSIATGWEIEGGRGGIGPGKIVDAIERIGAAMDGTPEGAMLRSAMQSPANENPHPRVIMQAQTEELARERLAAMLVLLSIAFARGEGLVWS